MPGGLRDPHRVYPKKDVSFGHEEQVQFDPDESSNFVGRAPAQMVDEGILVGDTRQDPTGAARIRAFDRRADAQYNRLSAAGESFEKSTVDFSNKEEANDYHEAFSSQLDARETVARDAGLEGYEPTMRRDKADEANASDTYREAFEAAGRRLDQEFEAKRRRIHFAGFANDPSAAHSGASAAVEEFGGPGPQVSQAAQSLAPRTGASAALAFEGRKRRPPDRGGNLQERFARANQVDFGGDRYRAPERYTGAISEKTLEGTDALQTHVDLRGRFGDQLRIQNDLNDDARKDLRKGLATGDTSAADRLWMGGGRGGARPYGFTNASTPERPYFQSLDPTRFRFKRDITSTFMSAGDGGLQVGEGEGEDMKVGGLSVSTVQGPKGPTVDVSNGEDLLMNELDAKDYFTDNRARDLQSRQQQAGGLMSYIQRKSSKQEANRGWKLFDPRTWFGHWGKNKKRARKIARAQNQLQALSDQWGTEDAAFDANFARFDPAAVATPRKGYQAPRASDSSLFTDPFAVSQPSRRRLSVR